MKGKRRRNRRSSPPIPIKIMDKMGNPSSSDEPSEHFSSFREYPDLHLVQTLTAVQVRQLSGQPNN